jgi:hypothetical protein
VTGHDQMEALAVLGRLGHELRTQDNRSTRDPVFCVQVLERIGPLAPGYDGDGFCFYDRDLEETVEPDDDRAKELYVRYRSGELPDHILPYHYKEVWITVQTCLTKAGGDRYLASNGHNLRRYYGTRVYVDSAWRNQEIVDLRKSILAITEV